MTTTRSIPTLLCAIALGLVAGCKKPQPTAPDSNPAPVTAAPAPRDSGKTSSTPTPPSQSTGGSTGGVKGVNGQGGGGGIFSGYKAARRTQALNELHQLGLLIEELRDPFGKMPTKDQIVASLKKTSGAQNIVKGIEEGAYILTGTTDGGGLWAYEVDADTKPGLALIAGTAQRTTPDDLKRYFPMQ